MYAKRLASTSSQPVAWVRSTSTSTRARGRPPRPRRAARPGRRRTAPRRARRARCRRRRAPAAPRAAPHGPARHDPDWARKGNVTLVNSPSGTSTVDPDGTAAATSATSGETWLPIATVDGRHVHHPRERGPGARDDGVVAGRVGDPHPPLLDRGREGVERRAGRQAHRRRVEVGAPGLELGGPRPVCGHDVSVPPRRPRAVGRGRPPAAGGRRRAARRRRARMPCRPARTRPPEPASPRRGRR